MCDSVTIQNPLDMWTQIKSEQGFIGKTWNNIKEFTNIGKSESDCESMLQAYNDGEVSLEEAIEYIEDFEKKQKDVTNLISNIATGVTSIAVATTAASAGPIGWGVALTQGAPTGAMVKTAINALDRATNDIENDEFDGKEILKDVVSGATTGATSAVSSKIYQGIKTANLAKTLLNGAKCGVACGALSGSSNYLTDCAIDEDKKFNFGDLTKATATSAFVSGTVGAAVGGGTYGIENAMGNIGKDIALSTGETIARDSALSTSRKILGSAGRKVVKS